MLDLSASFLYRQFWVPLRPVPPSSELKHKTAIITGATGGLGFEASKQLLSSFELSYLILGVRDVKRAEKIQAELAQLGKNCRVEVWQLNYDSFDSIQEFGQRARKLDRLDLVILNAGVKPIKFTMSPTGYETTLQVNHLATAFLSLLLLPILKETARASGKPSRMVIVSSEVHFWTPFEERHAKNMLQWMNEEDSWGVPWRYNTTKLFSVLWCRELAERTRAREVVINNVNPGLCWTGLHRDDETLMLWAFRCLFARPATQGAYAIVDAAVAQDMDSHGSYLSEQSITKYVLLPFLTDYEEQSLETKRYFIGHPVLSGVVRGELSKQDCGLRHSRRSRITA